MNATASSCADSTKRKRTRDNVREELRDEIRSKLATSTGNPDVHMHWAKHRFVKFTVLREHKVVRGWPPHIPFGDLGDIPGGVQTLQMLLEGWQSGAIYFDEATADELRRAVEDPDSVLPSTPLPPRPSGASKPCDDPRFVVGQLAMHPAHPSVVIRPSSAVPEGGDDAPAAKRLRMSGQREDCGRVRVVQGVRKRRRPKPGVKTERWLVDANSTEDGYFVVDKDLGRLLADGLASLE
ncbi:hypothetical protein OH76DRAFT_1490486 [Lentinus brumalis]|uniref:Uncharacterized protein n=1 Tax=Lentinus brumalis TaxID=2498619 RepID=A0A371CIV5_9APHY|nr:hypothetical protein OH76DRAFT_1490486 [Polyporus brumalis]